MRKLSALILIIFLCGCKPIEATSRDIIATGSGLVVTLQNQYLATCKADKTQSVCLKINQAVAANNLAIDALESYCGSKAFNDGNGPCVPNKNYQAQLQNAVQSLNQILTDVKGLVK